MVAWFVWRLACADRGEKAGLAGEAAAGAVTGVLLAAPALIASGGFASQAALGPHETGAYAHAHLSGHALSMLLLPYVYGPILGFNDPHGMVQSAWQGVGGSLFAGALVLLAVVGLASPGRRGLRVTLAAFLALALARMYGFPPLLRDVLGFLPRMDDIQFFRFAFPAVELAVIVLAALGLDDLVRVQGTRRRVVAATGTLALVAVAAVSARSLTRDLGSLFAQHPYFRVSVTWAALTVLAIGGAFLLRSPRLRVLLVSALVHWRGVGALRPCRPARPRGTWRSTWRRCTTCSLTWASSVSSRSVPSSRTTAPTSGSPRSTPTTSRCGGSPSMCSAP